MEGWWVPGRARGWAEVALEEVVAELVAEHRLDLDPTAVAVEPAKAGAKAPFRVDLRRLGRDAAPACSRLAEVLQARDDVVVAQAAPPGVFVLPTPAFLIERMAGAVVRHGPFPPRPPAARPPNLAFTFSDPNMNKPLHLGHFRNIVIGMSVTRLLQAQGSPVDVQALHSDWGIHIAQAVLGWLRWGDGATPESAGMKSDHFVGSFYARFHQESARHREAMAGESEDTPTEIERDAAALLQRMQDGDPEAVAANTRITEWVEAGVATTYERVGCAFDHVWRERQTTHLGVEAVHDGLARGVCRQRDDTSIYLDLSDRGLGEVTLLRSDGTPVVYTQWFGVDLGRYPGRPYEHILQMSGQEWAPGETVYTEVARDLGGDWVEKWTHFYYGMVTLTGGKMSSRAAGSTVLVDELLDDLVAWFGDTGDGEAAAAALTRFHFLAPKRLKDVVYSEETLRDETLPVLRRVLGALAAAEERSTSPVAGGDEPADADTVHALLLRLNGFPRLAQTAAQRLEPEYVATYLVDLAADVDACVRKDSLTGPTAAAAAITIRTGFDLLNVPLPERLSDLPPVLLED